MVFSKANAANLELLEGDLQAVQPDGSHPPIHRIRAEGTEESDTKAGAGFTFVAIDGMSHQIRRASVSRSSGGLIRMSENRSLAVPGPLCFWC